eukprot:CAMPEP_0185700756 /NCGR_PEP_ID=MMETSP1164-20130828/7665_1 /TAXON_ID=1104430 /ORGANISM="Chrysoreinhardia sp, Strain CCMP2950" /LENGTH=367 /DNA_ID=CAMNT_0028367707 /DNA_START=33 /DNA_END=1136 /DNA_ORIENTATION=-
MAPRLWLVAVAVAALGQPALARKQVFKDYWGKFCGVVDCYTELGLFPNATKVQIRRAYRNLSLEFHPDKNPGDRVAAEKFRRVARANEVLTNDEERKKLDYYTENPAEYFQLYGSYLEFAYAPKSSLLTVFVLLLLFASALQPAIQMSKYTQYCAMLQKAAIKKLPLTGGGTPESLELRRRADDRLKEVVKESAKQPGGKKKLTHREEKKKLEEIIAEMVADLDVPGEFRKPTLAEVPIARLAALPYTYAKLMYVYASIDLKKARGVALTEDEQQISIERYLGGAAAWEALTDDDQDDLLARACWERANFDAWKKERDAALAKTKEAADKNGADAAGPQLSAAKSKQQVRQRRKAAKAGADRFVMDD